MLHAVSLALLARLATNCSPDEQLPPPEEQYPILYKYERLDFKPPKLFVLNSNGSTEIPSNSGSYIRYADEYLKEAIDIYDLEFELEQVELLNDSMAKVYTFKYLNIVPSEALVTYKTVGDELQFYYDGELFLVTRHDANKNNLWICLKTTEYTYFDAFFNKKKHGSYDTDNVCDEGNPAAAVESVRTKHKLQAGDTVLLNYAAWVYPRQ